MRNLQAESARQATTLRVLAIVLALTSVWLVQPTAEATAELPPGGTFVDDNGSVHEPNIEAIFERGLTIGCNPPANDRFCPSAGVQRGHMAAFLDRALNLPATTIDRFVDDDESQFEAAINRLAAAGITLGCNPPDGDRFCPTAVVSRGAMAAFLTRSFGYLPDPDGPQFVDSATSVFAEDINALATAGVTTGCNPPTNDRFCPENPVTRQQMATMLARALHLDPIVPPPSDAVSLDIVARSGWGAAPAQTNRMEEHSIDILTVHHAGDQSASGGPPRYRSWQAFHQSRGWGDLAYHYIIGVDGTVYEARDTRYRGDTGTNYDPSGHFLLVVEGNFEVDEPTDEQLESLVRVLAWASQRFDVSPATIGGHRDHASTACPGGNLHPYIASGDLENDVRALLGMSPRDVHGDHVHGELQHDAPVVR
ncbi:MAG: N-acetylmuramoyl-L-alanine amidase [Acidimicrobiia bacterium]